MDWTECKLVAFDTETTGLRAFDGDRIIEFGAVEIFVTADYEIDRINEHQYLINPEMSIPREASNVSGIGIDGGVLVVAVAVFDCKAIPVLIGDHLGRRVFPSVVGGILGTTRQGQQGQ